ncbi:MAG TPA: acetyl-CoA carboxylase carboxyltransferase subunit alpha [Vicinamibacterales bacterium]|jgi:acetyl-CoA carboxylase carboxyl transferase subunit alpha|nr:acetyl-CoA carboxylase carboxyltransferase subunit alpha [Vicinamibacterales bacterium]|tara:strand:- start:9526 stop:10539 length:1014 start_codon:yes stop_codon:yes gene_type:complete
MVKAKAVTSESVEFEGPIRVLLHEIEGLMQHPQTKKRTEAIGELRKRLETVTSEVYADLTAWQRVQVARHPNRPNTLDYVSRLFSNFSELHGDRAFADDHAIICGLADYRGESIVVVGHQKGGADTTEKIFRNFGYAKPEGYRKAIRVMKFAEKFSRPIIVMVDTPAAYPGIESEERGVAQAIAYNLREMAQLSVPIIVVITGEGGSGGALGLAIGDRILMQEYAIYSVIPPEGCAAILWRDANQKAAAAEALKISAKQLLEFGVIDEIVPEPKGAAHADPAAAAEILDEVLGREFDKLIRDDPESRLDKRYEKFRRMGNFGLEGLDVESGPTAEDR